MKIKYILSLIFTIVITNLYAQYTFINYVSDSARTYIGSYSGGFQYRLKDSYRPDSLYTRIESNFGILRARAMYNDGSPSSIIWADNYGWVRRSPITAIGISMTQITNGLGYVPISTEIDPTVPAYVKTIAITDIINWNTAFSYGAWNMQGFVSTIGGSNSQYIAGNGSKITFPSIPTNNNQLINGSNYITGTYTGFDSKYLQSLSLNNSVLSISGSNSVTFPLLIQGLTSVGINSSELIITNSPLTTSGAITINLSTTGITSGSYIGSATFDSKGRAIAVRNPTFNLVTTGGRNFNQAYSISGTNYVDIRFSGSVSCNLSLSGGQAGEIYLEKSANGSTGWATIGVLPASNTGTLTIGLNTIQISGGQISTLLPPGYFWRFRTNSTTGTPTFTFLGGEEITY